jgi:hypothetical protein
LFHLLDSVKSKWKERIANGRGTHVPLFTNFVCCYNQPNMTLVSKIALLSSFLGLASARVSNQKYREAGFGADAWLSFDGCPFYGDSYVFANVYSTESNFKATGQYGYKSTTNFGYLNAGMSLTTCDESTIVFTEGFTYLDTYYGDEVLFTIDAKKLTSATIKDVQLPLYNYSCSYECTEICYPEIFGYGTCPETEEAYIDCYTTTCDEEREIVGVGAMDLTWTASSSPNQYSQISRSTQAYESYMSKSKGNYRDATTFASVSVEGQNILPSTSPYSNAIMSSTTYMDMTRYSN